MSVQTFTINLNFLDIAMLLFGFLTPFPISCWILKKINFIPPILTSVLITIILWILLAYFFLIKSLP